MYDERGLFVDYQLKDDFNEYISSLLIYKYTVKFTDLPIVGNKIFERYYADGKFDDPSRAVKVCTFWCYCNPGRDHFYDNRSKAYSCRRSIIRKYVFNVFIERKSSLEINKMVSSFEIGPCHSTTV